MRYALTPDLAGRSVTESGGSYFFYDLAERSVAELGGFATKEKGLRTLVLGEIFSQRDRVSISVYSAKSEGCACC